MKKRGRKPGQGIKLTRDQASEIKKHYYTAEPDKRLSLRALGRKYGVSHQTIYLIVNGAIWSV